MKARMDIARWVLMGCLAFGLAFWGSDAHAQNGEDVDSDDASEQADEPEADGTEQSEDAQDPSSEGAKEKARMHFRMGVDFYREGNYPAALVEFKRAYEVAPHYKLKFNLGQTALELQDYAYAIDNLTAYLREGADEVPEERKQQVAEMIEELNGRLAMVTITSNQADAEIYVDDRLVGKTPFSSEIPIGAGRRRIVAIKDGYVTVERRVDLAARDRLTLAMDFEDKPKAARVVVTKVVAEDVSPVLWMGIGTGVLAAGTVVAGVLTAVAKEDYDREIGRETTPEQLKQLKDDFDVRALITDVGIGVTSAAAIATLVVALLEMGDEEPAKGPKARATPETATVVPSLVVAPNSAALSLQGRF